MNVSIIDLLFCSMVTFILNRPINNPKVNQILILSMCTYKIKPKI